MVIRSFPAFSNIECLIIQTLSSLLKKFTKSSTSSTTFTSNPAFSLKSSTKTGTDDFVQATTALSIILFLKNERKENMAQIVLPLPTLMQKRHLSTFLANFTASTW